MCLLFAECVLCFPRFFLAYVMLLKIYCVIFTLWVSFTFRFLGLQICVWPAHLCIIHRHTCSQVRIQIEINLFFFLNRKRRNHSSGCKPTAPSTQKLFPKHLSKALLSTAKACLLSKGDLQQGACCGDLWPEARLCNLGCCSVVFFA